MSPRKKAAPPWQAPPPPVQVEEAPLTLPRFSSLWRLFLYPLCVLQPAAGLVLAAFYMAQSDKLARRFGRICLIFSVIGLILKGYRGGEEMSFRSGDSLLQPFY